jgi:hypothetical protein
MITVKVIPNLIRNLMRIMIQILSKGLLLPKGLLWREKQVQDDRIDIIYTCKLSVDHL